MASAVELYDRRELLWNLTLRELRGRYKRSIVGWGWSLLNPIAFMLIYWFAFSVIIQVDPAVGDPSGLKSYPLYLMCAFLPWTFFTVAVSQGMSSVVVNGALVRKVAFPREHLVNSVVLAGLFTFAVEFIVLSIVLMFAGNFVLIWILPIAVVTLLTAMFATGIGLGLATGNVFFRDMSYLWTIVTQVWFFVTPIVYPPALVEDQFGRDSTVMKIYNAIPMTVVVRMFRNMLYDSRLPAWSDFALLSVFAVATLLFGWWLFSRFEGRFAEEL